MAKYRKKPVIIEAIQFNGDNCEEIIEFTNNTAHCLATHTPLIIIPTLEGDHQARTGDWVIKGVKDEFYPCKPDIFDATYEVVNTPDIPTVTEEGLKSIPSAGVHKAWNNR